MKRVSKIFVLIIIAVLVITCFIACNRKDDVEKPEDSSSDNAGESQTEAAPKPLYTFVSGGKSDYVFLVSKNKSSDIDGAIRAIGNALFSSAKVTLETKTDDTSSDKEIIIGYTDREEVKELFPTLRYNDYVVTVKNGKLIVLGGCDGATFAGAIAFSQLIKSETLEYKEDDIILKYEEDYRIKSLKLNGTEITEFAIRYENGADSKFGSAIDTLQKRIQGLYGITLNVISGDIEDENAYEIVFGNCKQSSLSSVPNLTSGNYVLYASGNKIFVNASNSYAVKAGISEFCDKNIPIASKGEINISISDKIEVLNGNVGKYPLAKDASIRIMSNNILGNSTLTERSKLIVNAVLDYMPDILGFQECNATGYSQIIDRLKDYYAVATGKIEGLNTNSYTPILYLKDAYRVLETGTIFYDKRYTKTNTKTLSWAVFETIETGKKFIVLNTHCAIIAESYNLDPMTNTVEGALWREDNSRQILEETARLKEKYGISTPLMFMGDFNANANAKSIKMLEERYVDAINAATVSASKNGGSSHEVGAAPSPGKLPIDHIFVDAATVNVYTHLLPSNKEIYKISDHTPVIVDASFK